MISRASPCAIATKMRHHRSKSGDLPRAQGIVDFASAGSVVKVVPGAMGGSCGGCSGGEDWGGEGADGNAAEEVAPTAVDEPRSRKTKNPQEPPTRPEIKYLII